MYTFKTIEVVPASSIWPTAKSYKDKGIIPGYLRGYDIEVTNSNGDTYWRDCHFIDCEPDDAFNEEFELRLRQEWGLVPTGRITFRGYYTEYWYAEERDWCVKAADELNEEV
jgi:hypothetical protein